MIVMMDLKEKRSDSEDMNHSSVPSQANEVHKSCSDCHTTTTPLWRGGPAGPKTLCNACGIKYHKKKRVLLGLDRGRTEKGNKKKKKKKKKKNSELKQSLKLGLMALGGEMMLQRSSGKPRNKLGEEEEAAILLMALSYGSVYA